MRRVSTWRCTTGVWAAHCAIAALAMIAAWSAPDIARGQTHVVFGYNDLGMHCMNGDFSEICILPPFNTFRAQILKRGGEPDIVDEPSDYTVEYYIPSNTRSADKVNFWQYAQALFGVTLPPDFGLAGTTMRGTMAVTPEKQWEVVGVPLVPIDDNGRSNAYPLATIRVLREGTEVARTQAVMPVSTEISCNLCHVTPGVSTATDVLQDHDRLHGTNLEQNKPVLCASCHADNALGTPGTPGVPNLSAAMHGAHASRMAQSGLANVCYACHPGIRTQCQRDVHLANGVECITCHGDMAAVGDPGREPWLDEPRCSNCHARPGFDFEEPGKLFKDSRGHGGVHCAACHGSPHAITPTLTEVDNIQALRTQGSPGVIDQCTVCHTVQPNEPFFHSIEH